MQLPTTTLQKAHLALLCLPCSGYLGTLQRIANCRVSLSLETQRGAGVDRLREGRREKRVQGAKVQAPLGLAIPFPGEFHW